MFTSNARWTTFAISLVFISLSYSGFNAAVYLADEAIQPDKSVPRALLAGTGIVTAIYLAMNFIFLFMTPADAIAGRENVAMVAAESLGGVNARRCVQAIVCLALGTSITSMLMAAPRVYAKMADDGLFPKSFRFRKSKPIVATWTQVTLAILIVCISTLESLLGYLGLTLSVSAAATVSCLFLPRLGCTLWQKTVAAFFVSCTLGLGLTFAIAKQEQFLGAALTFMVGAAMYFVLHGRRTPTVQ